MNSSGIHINFNSPCHKIEKKKRNAKETLTEVNFNQNLNLNVKKEGKIYLERNFTSKRKKEEELVKERNEGEGC